MAQPNGKAPQHHLSVKELVALHRERVTKPWHWDTFDMDFLIRPRTSAETAALSDEGMRLRADIEQYAGTPDAPSALEQLRLGLRAALPCLLDPETKQAAFSLDEVDDLLEMDMATLNELVEAVNGVSTFTNAEAEEAAKNSGETGEESNSSVSRSEPPTPISSRSPERSTIS